MKKYPKASELDYEVRKYGLPRALDFGTEIADNVQKIDMAKLREYRVARAKAQMEKDGLGAMVLYEPWNIRYTTGFNVLIYARSEPRFYVLLPRNGEPYLWGMGMVHQVYRDVMPWLKGKVVLCKQPVGWMHSVGTVHQATIDYVVRRGMAFNWSLPVVAETWDGPLNDINGFHVKPEHVREAIESSRGGPVPEGNVGGGTGMVCNGFKGGIGTSSRVTDAGAARYTVGVLVQCNYGRRSQFKVAGIPWMLADDPMRPAACYEIEPSAGAERFPRCDRGGDGEDPAERGSIIMVVGTDAPLLRTS